jgi:tryptophan-rich sensory protein
VLWRLVACLAVCQAAGVIGSFFTIRAIPVWYESLVKPAITPPSWVFGPVWTALYALMAISLFLLWQTGFRSVEEKAALVLFAVQLGLNALWSAVFFGMKSPAGGAVEITVLWGAVLSAGLSIYRVSRTAGLLFVPYFLWVTFAAVLNFMIWALNS